MRLFVFLFSLSLFALTNTHAQKRYMQMPNGKIIDSINYEALKSEKKKIMLENLSNKSFDVTVIDNFKIIRQQGDSIILSYRWDYNINNGSNTKPQKNWYTDLLGMPFRLPESKIENIKGKPTLINFWFIACKPCVDEMPVLNQIKKEFNDKVNFVAITFDKKEEVEKFFKKQPFDFIHITDAKEFIDSLGISSFPVNVFLDRNGNLSQVESGIAYEVRGNGKMTMGNGKEFKKILKTLLN